MKPSEYIRRGWCQGAHAVSINGRRCDIDAPKARRFDIVGAMFKAGELPPGAWAALMEHVGDHRREEVERTVTNSVERARLQRKAFEMASDLARWNDQPNRTQSEVLDVLRRAGL